MTNECNPRGEALTMASPVADNGGIGPIANEAVMFGSVALHKLAAIAATSYTQPGSLVPTGNVGFKFIGVFFLTVTAKSVLSPGTSTAINPGDAVYADGGTYDATTGMTYGFTLDVNSSTGSFFGYCLDAVTAGVTQIARVLLKHG